MALLCLPYARSEENPAAPAVKEDPVSIFQSKIGDADVEFLMRGSWRATLSAATGLRFGPDAEVLFPFGLPGLGNGFFFEQVPALTFSVLLAQRWFLEVSVVSRLEDDTILLGYRGLPGEFVQRVLVGNKDTAIGSYDFLDLPAQSQSSLGASALFTTPYSSHELLLRYDSTTQAKKVFVGGGQVSELKYSPEVFLRGRYFMLPDANVENCTVYFEDKDGPYSDGLTPAKRYRAALASEIFLDAAQGFLYILIDPPGRILVHYMVGPDTVGDVGLGIGALPGTAGGYIDPSLGGTAFDWTVNFMFLGEDLRNRRFTINAQTCLVLWEPGTFSPFEMLSAYDLGKPAPEDISRVRVKLAPKGSPESGYTLPGPVFLSFNVVPGRRFFTVSRNLNARTDFTNHYPFPDPTHQLYGPALDHIPPYFEYMLYAEAATGVETYTLEANVIPDSIRVKRNGLEETRFTFNPSNYSLTFHTPILPNDRLEVTYRLGKTEKNAGDLVVGWGNRFPFDPLASLDLAFGLRWNILPGAYTEHAYEKTGALVFSAGLHGASEHFSYKVSGAVSYANPDTTGIMRLAGMEGRGLELEPGEDLASPASVPIEIVGLGVRGRLLYKNYREYDVLGGASLLPFDAVLPPEQVWSYTAGSKCGPYLVAGDASSSHGQSLVLDFELDNAGDWAGFQMPLAYKNGCPDLSGIHSLIASLRAVDVTGNFNVYFQIGAVAEDVDADGTLDEETSALAGGYTFDDSDNMVSLKVGGGPKNEGNGVINTEDIDGNGSLDLENSDLIFTAAPVNFSGDTGWSTYTRSVPDQNELKKARALRVIVVAAGGASNGRLLIDKLTLAGAAVYSEKDDPGATLTVREVRESMLAAPPAVSLPTAFPEVKDTFHAGGENQEVLEVYWDNGAIPFSKTIRAVLGDGAEGIRYRKFVLYVYRAAAFNANMDIELTDYQGRGIHASLPDASLGTLAWQKIELDFFNAQAVVNGTVVTAAVTVDTAYGSLAFFSLSVAGGDNDRTLLVDEIHLSEPEGRLGAAAAVAARLDLPGTRLAWGDVPVFSDVRVSEEASVGTAGFATLYSRPQEDGAFRSLTTAGAGIFMVGVEAEMLASASGDNISFSGGHTLTLPRIAFPVRFTDRYAQISGATGNEFFRENGLTVAFPAVVTLALQQHASSRDGVLSQNWSGTLNLPLLSPYTLSLTAHMSQAAGGFNREASWYLPGWVEGYVYTVPWDGGTASERTWQSTVTQVLGTKPLGVKLAYSTGYSSFDITTDTHRQKDTMSLRLSLPVTVDKLVIEPYYARSLTGLDTEAQTGDLGRDLAVHFSRYGAYRFFFTSIPFHEIIAPEANNDFLAQSAFAEQTVYKPEIGLTLSRQFGSSPFDLLLPSKVTVSYGKEFILQEGLFNAFERLSCAVLWNAINIFGAKSGRRLISLYDIDSYSTAVKTDFMFRETRELESTAFSLENAWTFEAAQGNKLVIRNNFNITDGETLTIGDKGACEYSWLVPVPGGIPLPLLDEKITRTGRIAHKESVEFGFQNLKETESAHPVTITLKHETAVQYPEFGYLRGEIALGIDSESYYESGALRNIFMTGIRLTLELNVKF